MRTPALSRFDPYRLLLLVLIASYIAIFFGLATAIHDGMRTHKADLGQIDQAIWNSSRGRFLTQTDNGYEATRLTDHVEPILVAISPIFWIWNDVRALLLLQTLLVAVGAWILYELSLAQFEKYLSVRERTQIWQIEPLLDLTRPLALSLAFAFLLAPALQSALLTEFHAAPLAVPLILWAFWAVDKLRWGQFLAAAMLLTSVKEEMALLAVGLGLWAMWRTWIVSWEDRTTSSTNQSHGLTAVDGGYWISVLRSPGVIIGAVVCTLSLFWFVVATFVIVPAYAAPVYGVAESGYFQRYGALGDSPADILRSFFSQPQAVWQIATEPARVDYLRGLLMAFGFLSLLAPEIVLLSLPLLLANVLSAYPAQFYGDFHYSAPLIPYFAVAAAYGLGRLWRWLARFTDATSANFQQMPASSLSTMAVASAVTNSRTAIRPLLTIVLCGWIVAWAGWTYLQHGRGPLAARYDPPPVSAHQEQLSPLIAQIPRDAALTATAAVHPHVSHRRYVYQFPAGLTAPVPADWALLDVTTNTDMAPGDLKARVDAMLAGDWGIVDAVDGFLLLARGAPAKTIPEKFYTFVRTEPPENALIQNRPLHLIGHEVDHWPRWRQTKLSGIWLVGDDFDPAIHQPQLTVRTPGGETVTSLAANAPPALVWYPPTQWQSGDTIKVTSLATYLPGQWGLIVDAEQVDVRSQEQLSSGSNRSALIAAYEQGKNDTLAAMPLDSVLGEQGAATTGRFRLVDGAPLQLTAAEVDATAAATMPLNVRMEWSGSPTWPEDLSVFVHLRAGDTNVAQADGTPRYFVSSNGSAGGGTTLLDWRQLEVPIDAAIGDRLQIVVGLYQMSTGRRLDLIDAQGAVIGQELALGEVRVTGAPVPDQACALVPATCASQSPQ